MSTVNTDSPYGPDRLTRGVDAHGVECMTARWHRVKGNCEIKVNINIPNHQTAVPLEEWLNLEPLIDRFVESVAYGPRPKDDGTAEGSYKELPALE